MIDKLKQMAIFSVIVEEGSFSAAARRLGMTASAISQHMNALEKQLGIALLYRSTRKLTLTEAGRAYYPGCKAMLAEAQNAEQSVAESRDTLIGEVRIAATVGIGSKYLAQALSPVLEAHPQLRLYILANDEIIDMLDERVDIALRVSHFLPDSRLIAHYLSDWPMVLCASPRYLSQQGIPANIVALQQHKWITTSSSGANTMLTLLDRAGDKINLSVSNQVICNSMNVVRAFTYAGMGISLQPLYEILSSLKRGELIRVMPEWQPQPLKLYAMTQERQVSEKTRTLLSSLRNYFSVKTQDNKYL